MLFDFSVGYTIRYRFKIHSLSCIYILILKVKNMVCGTFIFVLLVSTKILFFKTELVVVMWGRRKVKSNALALLTYFGHNS